MDAWRERSAGIFNVQPQDLQQTVRGLRWQLEASLLEAGLFRGPPRPSSPAAAASADAAGRLEMAKAAEAENWAWEKALDAWASEHCPSDGLAVAGMSSAALTALALVACREVEDRLHRLFVARGDPSRAINEGVLLATAAMNLGATAERLGLDVDLKRAGAEAIRAQRKAAADQTNERRAGDIAERRRQVEKRALVLLAGPRPGGRQWKVHGLAVILHNSRRSWAEPTASAAGASSHAFSVDTIEDDLKASKAVMAALQVWESRKAQRLPKRTQRFPNNGV